MLAKERTGARAGTALLLPVLLLFFTAGLSAQQPQQSLTLDEAIQLARQNNPDFLAQKNDAGVADWQVKQAIGGLLPGASANTSFEYQASGQPRFGTFTGSDFGVSETPAYYLSNYYLGVDYSLSGASLLAPRRAKASRRATNAQIDAADFNLRAEVTREYLAVVGAQDNVDLAEAELGRAEENRKLAEARLKVGAATPIDLKTAEVQKGRAQDSLLQAQNLVQTARLRLMQQLGMDMSPDVQLTTKFDVTDIKWSQDELVKMAIESHPDLVAARATEAATAAGVKMAKSAYLPSLSFSAGWSGYTRQAGNTSSLISSAQQGLTSAKLDCEFKNAVATGKVAGYPLTCPSDVLTTEMRSALISGNNVFPFNFTGSPMTAQVQISLPLFQGFNRELQVQQAKADAEDSRLRTRSAELRLKADVASSYLNASTARQSVTLEKRNTELANDQLNLARERYRLGAASFLELQDAETAKAHADQAYLAAVYSFHESMAALEAAVGRTLK